MDVTAVTPFVLQESFGELCHGIMARSCVMSQWAKSDQPVGLIHLIQSSISYHHGIFACCPEMPDDCSEELMFQ